MHGMRYRLELRKYVGADSVSRTKVCGHTCCGLASDAGFSRPIGLSLEHQQVAIVAGPANFVVFRAITTFAANCSRTNMNTATNRDSRWLFPDDGPGNRCTPKPWADC
ncbi:hypothetical protein ACFYXQ_37230 [Nocardia jiangxiensis]|uniref:Uncharacterized protein n=1 Tax=Nocardia jiangxiensis TaxID=282685 RepID=A0ABW6SAR7_9NOCA